jgi:hypothetical protein
MLPRSLRHKFIVGIVFATAVAIAMLVAIPRQFTTGSTMTAQAATTQCQTVCWRSAESYVQADADGNLSSILFATQPLFVADVNMNTPTANRTTWLNAMKGLVGKTPEARTLNRHMVAGEINLANYNLVGNVISNLNPLNCQGRTFTAVTLSNGVSIHDGLTFGAILNHTRNAVRTLNRNASDLTKLAGVFQAINGSFDSDDPLHCN